MTGAPALRFTLDRMADGGIHDQLGGGFHRYATDAALARPALRADALRQRPARPGVPARLGGARATTRDREVAIEVLDYMLRELTTDDGAFAASQDADTEGIEGLTFTWRAAEVREVLGDAAPAFTAAYGVTDDGNWEGVTILSRVSRARRCRSGEAATRRGRARGCWRAGRRGRSRPATTRRSRPGTG